MKEKDPKADKQLNVTLAPGAETTLVIREDNPKEHREPRTITINGTLKAPWQFLSEKKGKFKEIESHLRVFYDQGKLELHLQDTDPFTEHVITGSLKKDNIIDQFKINSEGRWTIAQFLKFVRTMRYFFADGAQCTALIASLQKFTANVETVIKEHSDTGGNSLSMLEKKVNQIELVKTFDLNVPIFQGYPKAKIKVEIGFDPKANQVDLFLISDELITTEHTLREKYMEIEMKEMEWFACSKITMS